MIPCMEYRRKAYTNGVNIPADEIHSFEKVWDPDAPIRCLTCKATVPSEHLRCADCDAKVLTTCTQFEKQRLR